MKSDKKLMDGTILRTYCPACGYEMQKIGESYHCLPCERGVVRPYALSKKKNPWVPTKGQKEIMASIARLTIDCMAHNGTASRAEYVLAMRVLVYEVDKGINAPCPTVSQLTPTANDLC